MRDLQKNENWSFATRLGFSQSKYAGDVANKHSIWEIQVKNINKLNCEYV